MNPTPPEAGPAVASDEWTAATIHHDKPDPMAWISTIGMFSGDDLMKEIDAEGARWRREQSEQEIAEM